MRTLIVNARLVDGTGAPARAGELLIEDEHIADINNGRGLPAPDQIVDAEGGVLAPGFIDVHSHSDFVVPVSPEASAKTQQGVTTEVVGNCGMGLTPANERVEAMYRQYGPLFGGDGAVRCSRDLESFRTRLARTGTSVNLACLVPHGNVRCAALGLADRAPTPSELRHMEDLVALDMEQGAFGLSTGLIYPPGAYAATDELVRLARVAGARGGVYASHIRDEATRLEPAIEEALHIGEAADVPVQISHHKASGRYAWGKVRRTLRLLEEARGRGLVVHSDMYPYTAGATMLAAMLVPLWVFASGDPAQALEVLKDPKLRPRVIRDARRRLESLIVLPGRWNRLPKRPLVPAFIRKLSELVVVGSVKYQKAYEGKTLREIAELRGQPVIEAGLDLLVEEDGAVIATAHLLSEDDVRTVLLDAYTMVGTDGMPAAQGKPHPRAFGTYPRILEHYVGRLGLLSLEAAIHKMTGLPAKKFGLAGRGLLQTGGYADLLIFHPERVRDNATYIDPCRFPDGIEHVWVSGEQVVHSGGHTGARPGRVLRFGSREGTPGEAHSRL